MSATGDALAGSPPIEVRNELGLRARSKQQTRAAIIAKSLKLFGEHGYDVVTTQEIANDVGITQRTLFRYFERKDSIIYASEYNYVARFETYLEQAFLNCDTPYDTVRAAFNQLAVYFSENRQMIAGIYAIIQVSDQLKTLERMHQTRIDWLVACALDGREIYQGRMARPAPQPSLRSRITASVLFGAIRPTLRAWLTGELNGDLRSYADVVWDNIRPIFDATQAYAAIVAAALETRALSQDENGA
jgi:AcrR family transcriptional regulator